MRNPKLIDNQEMIRVPGGTFKMGSSGDEGFPDEKPQHDVTLEDFYMTPYHVTVREYVAFLNDVQVTPEQLEELGWILAPPDHDQIVYDASKPGDKRYSPARGCEKQPIVYVSWFGANEFCKWANVELPTEEQFEYAAGWGPEKAPRQGTRYPLGNEFEPGKYSFCKSSIEDIGQYPANGLGLYDMAGLAWQWTKDPYTKDYSHKVSVQQPSEQKGKHVPQQLENSIVCCSEEYIIVEDSQGLPVVYIRQR